MKKALVKDVQKNTLYWMAGTGDQRRVYHHKDTNCQGTSLTIATWAAGQEPPAPQGPPPPLKTVQRPPRFETYAPLDTTGLVVQEQQRRATGARAAPQAPRTTAAALATQALACRRCGQITCRCGVPALPTWAAIHALQQQRGQP
jgi:hypothetical protein